MNNFSTFENLNTLFTYLGNILRGKPTVVELTQAQYNALTPAQKSDTSKCYYITDSSFSGAQIDDTTIANDKLWSSNKTKNYIDSVITDALNGSY